jgi:hypothetical protein
MNDNTGRDRVSFPDVQTPPRSVAADAPSDREMPLISIALVSLGLWAGLWAAVSSLIGR